MKRTTLKLVTAAMIISATALFVGGCSNKAQDIDLTLIGGDGQDIENRYTVDIRYDTDEAPINSDTDIVISTAEPEEISEPDIPKEETTAPETTPETAKEALTEILPVLEGISDWTVDSIHAAVFARIGELGVKNGWMLWPLRTALSGKPFTPGGGIELCAILGKDETLKRVQDGINRLS